MVVAVLVLIAALLPTVAVVSAAALVAMFAGVSAPSAAATSEQGPSELRRVWAQQGAQMAGGRPGTHHGRLARFREKLTFREAPCAR